MKTVKIILFVWLGLFVLGYIIASFVSATFNITQMPQLVREATGITIGCCCIFSAIIITMYKFHPDSEL